MKANMPAESTSAGLRMRGQFISPDVAQQEIELYFAMVMD
jgi:hypothetical protein